jgi:hypothetical protein
MLVHPRISPEARPGGQSLLPDAECPDAEGLKGSE